MSLFHAYTYTLSPVLLYIMFVYSSLCVVCVCVCVCVAHEQSVYIYNTKSVDWIDFSSTCMMDYIANHVGYYLSRVE